MFVQGGSSVERSVDFYIRFWTWIKRNCDNEDVMVKCWKGRVLAEGDIQGCRACTRTHTHTHTHKK